MEGYSADQTHKHTRRPIAEFSQSIDGNASELSNSVVFKHVDSLLKEKILDSSMADSFKVNT